jgi:hypothetical protein
MLRSVATRASSKGNTSVDQTISIAEFSCYLQVYVDYDGIFDILCAYDEIPNACRMIRSCSLFLMDACHGFVGSDYY